LPVSRRPFTFQKAAHAAPFVVMSTAANPAIGENSLFTGVPPEAVDAAAERMRTVFFPAGEVIFREGDPGHGLYLVMAGSVRISVRGREQQPETLDIVQAGDFFGEMAMIDKSPRSATATAAESCLLGVLDDEAFALAMRSAPAELSTNFIRAVVARLRHANTHFVEELVRNERLSLLGRMSSSIIHDFKNPMATILFACQMIERKAKDPQMARYTTIIDGAVDQMVGMTQELLEYSRGVTRLNIERVLVGNIVAQVEEQCLARVSAQSIKVERAIAYVGWVNIDSQRFLRLLLNLLKNAQEAMPNGGLLRFSVRAEGSWLVWEISDNGCGMPPEILTNVFEPFLSHGKSGGTGLGMTIAKNVAEAHGGTIEVDSYEGKGTTCIVRIPLAS
jgi:signal transduction histidine kinase